jgi:hypothetical protein
MLAARCVAMATSWHGCLRDLGVSSRGTRCRLECRAEAHERHSCGRCGRHLLRLVRAA